MFWLWYELAPRQAWRSGFLFGIGLFGVGVSWVYVAIHVYGETSAPVAVLVTALFVTVLALITATQAVSSVVCLRYLPQTPWRAVLAYGWIFPVNWVLFEWIRSWLFTGFPWLNLGYSQIDTPLGGYAPVTGVLGVSLLTALSAGLVLILVSAKKLRLWAGVLLLVVWGGGYGLLQYPWTYPVDDPITVAIVQGNQDQLTKWDADKIKAQMRAYVDLSEPYWQDSDLIIWPENALTVLYPLDVPADYINLLKSKVHKYATDLIIGLPYGDYHTYYSSLLVVGDHQEVYNKRHLVPFGEYVPLQSLLRGLIGFLDLPMSSFTAGAQQQPLLVAAGQPMAPSICYEDAFGEELIDFLPQATLLVNGSNNAWYGNSWAPHQHLQISRMRALETGRMSMRATTNGISAIIDEHGKVLQRSPQFVSDVLTAEVQPRQGATPYVSFGNWPVLSVFLLSGLALLIRRVKPRRVTHTSV
ncbi:MAG: apolipoprotein N-acyltransferase [Gammaproteobacteria bacterium]|nr:apolipoprotein N-acyltransferase [Gammaproteobacteria bacterium]